LIVNSISLLTFIYILGILFGFARDVSLVYIFGASSELDAFLIGYSFVRNLSVQIVLVTSVSLIPIYISCSLNIQDNYEDKLIYKWVIVSSVFWSLIAIIISLFSYQIALLIGPNLNRESIDIVSKTIKISSPLLLILTLWGSVKVVLDSNRLFQYSALLQIFLSSGVIVGAFVMRAQFGVYAAAIGGVIGAIAGLICQILVVLKKLNKPILIDGPQQHKINLPIRSFAILFGCAFIMQLQGVIDKAAASYLGEGMVTSFVLAISILGIPSAMILPAVTTILLPDFTAKLATNNINEIKTQLANAIKYVLIISGPLSIVIFIFHTEIVRILFGFINFETTNIISISEILQWSSLGIVFYAIGSVLKQIILSRKKVSLEMTISVLSLIFKMILLFLLVPHYGAIGLGAAISLGALFWAILYLVSSVYYLLYSTKF